jgi:tetratricopeptide (TPR) repeat protein
VTSGPAAASRAQTLLSLGRPAEAMTVLSTALATEPDSAELLRLLARAHLLSGQPFEAQTVAKRAIALEPDHEWGHRILSQAYSDSDDYQSAMRAAAESQRLAPSEWRGHVVQAIASAHAGYAPEALAAARYAVQLAPNEPETHFAMGFASKRAGDLDTAEKAYRHVLSIQPDHAMALNNLSALRLNQRGGLRDATRGFGSALASDAQLGVARRNLSVIARRYARRFHLAVVVAYVVLNASFSGDHHQLGSDRVPTHSRLEAGAFGLVALAIVLAAIVMVDRRLPANLRPYFRRLPRSEPLLGAWLGVDLVALLLISAIALPATYSGRSVVSGTAWAFLLIGLALSYGHRSSLRSRMKHQI